MLVILGLVVCSLAYLTERPLTVEQLISQPVPEEAEKLTGEALVNYVNKRQGFFKAEFSQLPPELKTVRWMDAKYLIRPKETERKKETQFDEELPERFDAREEWPDCVPVISVIRDESNCGSGWAISAASTMSDRLCIQSKGKIKALVSDIDILSCCKYCGYGCNGGYPGQAWRYLMKSGVCTGGPYNKRGVCKPYTFHPCGFHVGQQYYGECPEKRWETPQCVQTCQNGYPISYQDDKIYGRTAYYLEPDERAIRKEIMTLGPVQTQLFFYEDLRHYKNGIYIHTAGRLLGAHCVKIIGWGSENGTDYWLIANSWNTDWGENGYFRILRGQNHCKIEHSVIAGTMK